MHGSVGPSVIDIRKLYGEIGCFTYDPGYGATGSCESAITYIDGEEGILLHRGYSIDDLANKSSFLEVAYLLLNGELPKKEEKEEFENAITLHTMVHEQLINFYRGFRRDAHPMAIMVGVVGALSAFYPDSTNIDDPYERMVSSRRLIAKIPTIAAMAYKYSLGQPFNYPLNDLNYSENFLNMCREKYKLTVSGAMAIPPKSTNPEKYFKVLKNICVKNNLKEISMGMSHDYEKAIELGSTNIRIGTKLFGKRN